MARLTPVDYDPFSPMTTSVAITGDASRLTPVDYDPFAEDAPTAGVGSRLTPVDYDPFAEDSWLSTMGKVVSNAPAAFVQAAGGLLRGAGEAGGEPNLSAGLDYVAPNDPLADTLNRQQEFQRQVQQAPGSPAAIGGEMYRSATADLNANQPNIDPNSAKGYAYDIASAGINMAPALTAGIVTKSPTIVAAIMGGQVAGQKYGESREAGRSADLSTGDASVYALAELLTERLPMGKIIKEGTALLPRIAGSAATEGAQEMLTEAIQAGYDAGIIGEDMTWGQAWDRIKRAGIVGVGAGGTLAAAAHPFVGGEKEQKATEPPSPAPEPLPEPPAPGYRPMLDDGGVQIGWISPDGLDAIAMDGKPAPRPESPLALPPPTFTRGDGFTMGAPPSGVSQEIARRQKAAAKLAEQIRREQDPAKRDTMITQLRDENRAVAELRRQNEPSGPVARTIEDIVTAQPDQAKTPTSTPTDLEDLYDGDGRKVGQWSPATGQIVRETETPTAPPPAPVTAEDVASPLPTRDIADGKALLDDLIQGEKKPEAPAPEPVAMASQESKPVEAPAALPVLPPVEPTKPAALPEPVVRVAEAASPVAQPTPVETAPAISDPAPVRETLSQAVPPITRSDGTPFSSERSASLSARQRPDLKGRDLEPVQIEGGWGLRERVSSAEAPSPQTVSATAATREVASPAIEPPMTIQQEAMAEARKPPPSVAGTSDGTTYPMVSDVSGVKISHPDERHAELYAFAKAMWKKSDKENTKAWQERLYQHWKPWIAGNDLKSPAAIRELARDYAGYLDDQARSASAMPQGRRSIKADVVVEPDLQTKYFQRQAMRARNAGFAQENTDNLSPPQTPAPAERSPVTAQVEPPAAVASPPSVAPSPEIAGMAEPTENAPAAQGGVSAELTGEEIEAAPTIAERRGNAQRYYNERLVGRSVINRETGWKVSFDTVGAKKTVRVGDDLLQIIPALPKLIENGRLIDSQPDNRGRPDILAVHRFAGRVNLRGEPVHVVMTVRQRRDGSFHYSLQKDADYLDNGGPVQDRQSGAVETASTPKALEGTPVDTNIERDGDQGNPADGPNLYRLPQPSVIPQFSQAVAGRRAELGAALRRELDRIGLKDIALRLPDRIDVMLDGRKVGQAEGRYNRGIIDIAMHAVDPAHTLSHEAIHALHRLGLFSTGEWNALTRAANDDWRARFNIAGRYGRLNASDAVQIEEAIADAYAAWRSGKLQVGGFAQRAFNQMRKALEAIGRVLREKGFTRAADLIEAASTGLVNPLSALERINEGVVGRRDRANPVDADMQDRALVGSPDETVYSLSQADGRDAGVTRGKPLDRRETDLINHILAPLDERGPVRKAVADALEAAKAPAETQAEVTRQMVNIFQPIAEAEKRASGGKLRDAKVSAFKAAEFAVSESGRLEQLVTSGPLRWNADEGITEVVPGIGGLADIFAPLDNRADYQRFAVYAAARRARRLAAEGRERLLSSAQIADGLAMETPAFRAIFDRYQTFNKAMLDFAVDTGILARESADLFGAHADYVPFYRVMDEDPAKDGEPLGPRLRKALNNPDPGIKKLEGGKQKIGDLLDNISRNAMALAKAGLRNEALRRTHDLMIELGEADTPGAHDSRDGAISYYKNGRRVYFIPHDAMLTTAVAGFRAEQRGPFYRTFVWLADVLRDGITLFPAFTASNQFRGTMAAWVQTGANFGTASNTAKGILRALKDDAVAREMKTIAGVGGYTFGGTSEEVGKMLRRRLGTHAAWTPADIVRRAVKPLEKAGEVSEMSDRIAIYENLLSKGASKAEAAYQALNAANFTRKGANKTLRWLIPLVPFLNARIQGLYRLGETASTPGGRKRIMMGIAARGLLLTGASMALLASYDDDDWARYDDMPLEAKLNYYLVFTDEGVVRIPKPFEFGALFSTLPEMTLDAIRRKDGKDLAKATAMTFLNTFSFLPVPAGILPELEAAVNFDTFRMGPLENQAQQRLAPGLRADANTSGTAREISRRLDISPIKLEHLINGHLGTFGGTLLAASDSILSAAGLIPEKPAGNFGSVPIISDAAQAFLGRFYRRNTETGSRAIGKFYDLKGQVDEIYNSVRELQRQGRAEEATELLNEGRAMLSARRGLDRTGEHLSDLNARIRRVRDAPGMTGEQKQEMLEKLIGMRNEVARRGARYEYRIQDAQERMGAGQ